MIPNNTVIHDRYKIIREIVRGGMGIVYLAEDQRLDAQVALKVSFFNDERLRVAFEREAKLLANLRHHGLPRVSDHFVFGEDTQALAMDYIAGDSLLDLLGDPSRRDGRGLAIPTVLGWADQLLLILQYLHGHDPQILHRDVKPQNIKLMPGGQIVLLDFGLAKGMASSVLGASLAYAPIEQVNGTGTTVRSDIFSVGATIYHLITGDAPWSCTWRLEAIHQGQPDPLPPPHEVNKKISPEISYVISWAMSLDASRRPASIEALREALRDAAIKSGDPTLGFRTRPPKTGSDVQTGDMKQDGIDGDAPQTNQGFAEPAMDPIPPNTSQNQLLDTHLPPSAISTKELHRISTKQEEKEVPVGDVPRMPAHIQPPLETQPSLPLTPSPSLLATMPVPSTNQGNAINFKRQPGSHDVSTSGAATLPRQRRSGRTLIAVGTMVALLIVVAAAAVMWRTASHKNETAESAGAATVKASPLPKSTLKISTNQVQHGKESIVSARHQFRKGDGVRFKIQSSFDGIIYLISKDPAGTAQIIYPNKQINDGNNSIKANTEIRIPETGTFDFDHNSGTESLYIVVAADPSDETIKSIEQALGKGSSSVSVPAVRDLFSRLDQKSNESRESDNASPETASDDSVLTVTGNETLVGVRTLNHVGR